MRYASAIICMLAVLLAGVAGQTRSTTEPPLGLLPLPGDGKINQDAVAIGKSLFFDVRLSADGKRSCATCHVPDFGFAEPARVSAGMTGKPLQRNAPTLLNVGYLPILMWDGRFSTLERQALQPFSEENEMGGRIEHVLKIVSQDSTYRARFRLAFRGEPTADRIAAALAAYERSLVAGNSKFDLFLFGQDKVALSESAERGFGVFIRANCILCHEIFHSAVHPLGGNEALFTDFRFHNLGVGYKNGVMIDLGRSLVTERKEDWGRFKTPTLRNVALTAPYMHDGSLPTLRDVVKFYNQGGIPNPNLDPAIRPLGLTDVEIDDLVQFLESLTSPDRVSFKWPDR
jgi:cytochrome c peroxidase